MFSEVYPNGGDAYAHLRNLLLREGRRMTSRVGEVYELEDVTFMVSPQYAVPFTRPGWSPGLGLVHAAEMVAQKDLTNAVHRFAPKYSEFSDGYGTYGPRLQGQIAPLIAELKSTPYSRRAVLSMWDAGLDMKTGLSHSDHPCTIALSFRIRSGKLNMTAHMRSNDIYLGTPHDMVQFTVLQLTLANILEIEPGNYVHHADSLHLYKRDTEKSEPIAELNDMRWRNLRLTGFGFRGCTLEEAQEDVWRASELDLAPFDRIERSRPESGAGFVLQTLIAKQNAVR